MGKCSNAFFSETTNMIKAKLYVKTMSCSGSHLGIPINIKNTKFVKELPMIDAQFRFNQCNSFKEEHISHKWSLDLAFNADLCNMDQKFKMATTTELRFLQWTLRKNKK
jgi:hypothetical protein